MVGMVLQYLLWINGIVAVGGMRGTKFGLGIVGGGMRGTKFGLGMVGGGMRGNKFGLGVEALWCKIGIVSILVGSFHFHSSPKISEIHEI